MSNGWYLGPRFKFPNNQDFAPKLTETLTPLKALKISNIQNSYNPNDFVFKTPE